MQSTTTGTLDGGAPSSGRTAPQPRAGARRLSLVEGPAVAALAPDLDRLAATTGAGITAGGAWLATTLIRRSAATPWAVVLREEDGALAGAVVLLDEPDGLTVLAGTDGGHRVQPPTADLSAAALLAHAVAAHLRLRAGHRTVRLAGLAAGPLAHALVRALPQWPSTPGLVPAVRRDPTLGPAAACDVASYLSSQQRRTLHKAHNRLERDGVRAEVVHSTDAEALAQRLPVLAQAYRERDHSHGLLSDLDSPAGLACWEDRVTRLTAAGVAELSVLTLDGVVAAYVVGLVDRPAYRVLEGRLVTAFSRYAPGRLLESAVLQRVLADPDLVELDWMTGVAPETLITANSGHAVVTLASPSPSPSPAPGEPSAVGSMHPS